MNMVPIKSSNISAVGYDPESRTLGVQFKTGAEHHYADVPPERYAAMTASDPKHSVGSYFHTHIKSAYKSTKAGVNK